MYYLKNCELDVQTVALSNAVEVLQWKRDFAASSLVSVEKEGSNLLPVSWLVSFDFSKSTNRNLNSSANADRLDRIACEVFKP